jgi:tRNA nucleotidyltransferase (CCA-adding enzyme)
MLDALRAAVPVTAAGVWLVGGSVRDTLLDREMRELDLLVEGDAIAVARDMPGEVVAVHERFGTATVRTAERLVDLASARRETYARPGGLPEVELGATVEEDLRRRDFTVNAMAVRVSDGEFRAVTGAEEDLRSGRLRTIHPGSFADDPTRMLRMARYAGRLGFAPVAEVDPALLRTLTPTRVGAELRLACWEPQPETLGHIHALGLGGELFGEAWAYDRRTVTVALELCPGGLTPLGAALRGDVRERLDELGFKARERDVIAAAAATDPLVGDDPVGLWRLLRRQPPEAVAAAGARGEPHAAARWLAQLRHVRPQVHGDELVAAGLGGPAVGQALERATEVALRGGDREAQLRAAVGEDVAG